ncbi:MAG: hypothetical protein Q9214_002826 [Letrouitia sp. 1 TL-2023]
MGFDTTTRDTTIDTPHPKTNLTPLITAICQKSEEPGSEEAESALLPIIATADPNTTDASSDYGFSPVMWSVKEKKSKALELLLVANADLNFCDKSGKIAAHIAVDWDSIECLSILLRRKSGLVSATDSKGSTPLHTAIDRGSKGMAELLIGRNADVDATDNRGQTPLHLAVDVSSSELTKLLLQHNPNPNIKNQDNRTALEESKKQTKWGQISALIEDYESRWVKKY